MIVVTGGEKVASMTIFERKLLTEKGEGSSRWSCQCQGWLLVGSYAGAGTERDGRVAVIISRRARKIVRGENVVSTVCLCVSSEKRQNDVF